MFKLVSLNSFMGNYNVILTCRNSEKIIEPSLTSIIEQSIKPKYIIVVDDGSTDNTPNILKHIQTRNNNIYIITNPDLGYDIGRVVQNWNKALRIAKQLNLETTDYHMIAQDDNQYEHNYCEKIIRYMDSDSSIAIASGKYDNMNYYIPRGAGRFIRNSFFTSVHGYYPEKMGSESALVYSAIQNHYKGIVVPGVRYIHSRELGKNYNFYEFGASMKTLGYHPLYALARFVKYFCLGKPLGRIGSLYMLYHYLSYKPKEEGYDSMFDKATRKIIRRVQTKRIMDYISLNKS
jgi:glycosyltransferase involved in cell wall biosynthesis